MSIITYHLLSETILFVHQLTFIRNKDDIYSDFEVGLFSTQ